MCRKTCFCRFCTLESKEKHRPFWYNGKIFVKWQKSVSKEKFLCYNKSWRLEKHFFVAALSAVYTLYFIRFCTIVHDYRSIILVTASLFMHTDTKKNCAAKAARVRRASRGKWLFPTRLHTPANWNLLEQCSE